ncbi:MalY/PatB family protein [Halalkalibacter akibai]|uniref:cysteine-S-conjugate beta-lyase n=1 Tax=Halalkalibacter akibai (strain ATCC 43226 / DSM 21942 / CIP 109018 / JCM 9157 / 1139) TaxID=1236973 RepID=W4QSB5_HALA3|nr:MalY/PatB family protein [Halalkalibacter akibai]GAE34234.1 cystathionine beta-lyase [Halalkalibacter akibai JCM 9157]
MSERFNEVIQRRGTNSLKWDMTKQRFGGENLLPMWVADMDFRAPQEVLQALHEVVEHGIFGYPAHSTSVDQAVQSWLSRRYDWKIETNSLIYTAGIVPTISYIIQAFTEPEDQVIIQTPVYYPFYDVVNKNNRELIRNPLAFDGERYEMDLDHLESVITEKTKMIVVCHPHNPVGRVWKKEELQALAEVCRKYDLLVVSDEIHADLLFKGQKHVPFASVSEDAAERTFTCLAPSKTFNLAGIQTSYVVVENKLLRTKLTNHLSNSFANMTNSFAEAATEAAYNHGEQWLEELMNYVEENFEFVKNYVNDHMPKLRVMDSEGTYLLWLECSNLPLSPAERKKWLIEDAQVALNPGSIFGDEGKDFERINLACPRATLEEGLNRMKNAYDQKGF